MRHLLHFLAIGLALFVGDRVLGAWLAEPERELIRIDARRVEEVRRQWIARTRSLPTELELERLVEAEVDDEILFREAVSLGFVETDPVVRRRLVRNVRFLGSENDDEQELFEEALELGLERSDPVVRRRLVQRIRMGVSGAARREAPTSDEMRARYQQSRSRYVAPARLGLAHVYVSRDAHGEAARERASALRKRIDGQELDVGDAVRLGDPFLRGHRMASRSERDLAGVFGPGLAKAVFGLAPREWSEPIESAYGFHLVWIEESVPARQRPLEEVESQVREEIFFEREARVLRETLERLRTFYDVEITWPAVPSGGSAEREGA